MEKTEHIHEVRRQVDAWRTAGLKVGFVPTMGFLHEGHLALVERAKMTCDKIVVSIFVNPTQFSPGEDLDSYPRDESGDLKKLREAGTHLVFLPMVETLYPKGEETIVELGNLPNHLCGLRRPGHFRGVATVCTKLFNIVRPHEAVFGTKDFQQVQVLKKMVRDLCMELEIITVETRREVDGLAMSSRNAYLTKEERRNAPILYRCLTRVREQARNGEKNASLLIQQTKEAIEDAGGIIDYIEIVNSEDLESVPVINENSHMLVAAFFGRARLIDNAPLIDSQQPV